MGRMVVKFSPQILQQLITAESLWKNQNGELRVSNGIPSNASFISGWYDDRQNAFILLFEHPEWPEVEEDKEYPVFDPILELLPT